MKYRSVIALLVIVGGWQLGHGTYIYLKASVAQYLIHSSWESAIGNNTLKKPWPWADTWPVSRIIMPKYEVDVIVLAGDNGRTLAFGPGHRFGTAAPGKVGNSVISAHRDTHFSFLEKVVVGDRFMLQSIDGSIKQFRIVNTQIVDYRQAIIPTSYQNAVVTLVTCYPFDAIRPGSPLRYLVFAEEVAPVLWT